MPLKPSAGNMYTFVTHTWGPVKGKCGYDCQYCYIKRWGKQNPIHLDESEMRANLGSGNFIFICSGCDLFHPDVHDEWIEKVLHHAWMFRGNKYLLHTKNPARILNLWHTARYYEIGGFVICVTVESNIPWPGISTAQQPYDRFESLRRIECKEKMITIEPIMDFDVITFANMIISCDPIQVNIGADSGRNNLPEPTPEKIERLIEYLKAEANTPVKIHLKNNLRRILPKHRLYEGNIG